MTFPENLWTINITSFANTHALTSQLIEDALNSYKTEFYQKKYEDNLQKRLLTYNNDEIASWQINKKAEIREKWFENYTYSIDGDKVILNVKFEVAFPYDWHIDFIIEWAAGFTIECLSVFNFVKVENIMELFNDVYYRRQAKLLQELCDNESTIATNNSKTPPQIKFEGLTFDFQIIPEGEAGTSDGDEYRMVYVLTDCDPTSKHYPMWA